MCELEKLDIVQVDPELFKLIVKNVATVASKFAEGLDLKDSYASYDCYLAIDCRFGFCVHKDTKELCNVFSIEKRRGDEMLQYAKQYYSELSLNCFDIEKVIGFYQRNGFVEKRREDNYDPSGPDVVFLEYQEEKNEFLNQYQTQVLV
ncbi:hypothetical protein ACFL0U_02780 [Pseudomonadota bacterium]